MLVTLDIDDEEVSFFIKLAKSLPFVNEVTSEGENVEPLPEWHLQVIEERFKNIESTEFVDTTDFIKSLK